MQINSVSGSSVDAVSMQKMMLELRDRWFKKLDADGDGGIDAGELSDLAKTTGQSASEIIQTYDADQDGVLNADEMDAMMKTLRPPHHPDEAAEGGKPPPPPPDMKAEWFNTLDSDRSGGIDATELTDLAKHVDQTADALLNRYDTNGDGVLDASELDAMMQALRPQDDEQTAEGAEGSSRDGMRRGFVIQA